MELLTEFASFIGFSRRVLPGLPPNRPSATYNKTLVLVQIGGDVKTDKHYIRKIMATTKDYSNYYPYIYKVLKQTEPALGLYKDAKGLINGLLIELVGRLVKDSPGIPEVEAAVNDVFAGDLAAGIIAYAQKHTKLFEEAEAAKQPGSRQSKTSSAGLTFSIARVTSTIKTQVPPVKVASSVPAYVAGVLESVTSKIFQFAGEHTVAGKHKRISRQDVLSAIHGDPSLKHAFPTV